MLSRLSVQNLAIVESAAIEFGPGLNIITGETGAGKSVLMGALGLALGARADASAVRDGAKDARVEAEFSLDGNSARAVADLLEEHGLPPVEEGVLLVRRTISSAAGGRVWVNDAATTVQTLRSLGRILVDVHGPNDHQSLLDESFQRRLLDSYGKVDTASYSAAWSRLSDLRLNLAELQGDTSDVAEECERLRYAVDEIDSAQLAEEDETDLPARHAAAAHAAEIVDCANAATSALSGDEDVSAVSALMVAGGRLAEMSKYHEPALAWRDELEEITLRIQELSRSIDDSVSRLDTDPAELQALDDRMTLVQRLKRKYAPTVPGILKLRDEKANRLADLEGRDARIKELSGEIAKAEQIVMKEAKALTIARGKAAARLSAAITRELHGLGFLKASFGIDLAARTPDASGADAVDFRFEPNPGESARSLAAIASTGEIARVMLAVKTVTAGHDAVPVLVFDEIDSNIGGETGRAVGERLRAVAKHHQVIAITHLAQSAVYGERHLAVSKAVSGGRTRSAIRELEGEERVAEIARMLGGAELTSVVTRHARELLALSLKPRQ